MNWSNQRFPGMHFKNNVVFPFEFQMPRDKNNSFFREMKPMLIFMRALGIFPFTINEKGVICTKLISLVTLYTLVCQFTMITLASFVEFERIQAIFSKEETFIEHLIDGAIFIIFLPVFFMPITFWLEITKMVKYLNDWGKFQAEFIRATNRDVNLPIKHRMKFVFCIIIIILIILEADAFLVIRGLTQWWHGIPFGFSAAFLTIMPYNWWASCKSLITASRALSQAMEENLKVFGWSREIGRYRRLWLKLSYLTQDLGQTSGFTYGIINLIFFTIQIFALYGFINSSGFVLNLVFASAAIVFIALIYIQCSCAELATQEVGLKFQEKLETMSLHPTTTHNKETKYNIRYFLQTTKLNPPVITYSGFVDVNRKLLVSLMSATVTYLVVLTQFQMSSPQLETQNCTQTTTPSG